METPRTDRDAAPRWVGILALGAAVATAIAIVTVDRPVARAIGAHEPLALWDAIADVLEWTIVYPLWRFALPVGLVVGMIATVLVPRWRGAAPAWTFVAGVHLVTRYAVTELKEATGRLRPTEWLARGTDDTFGWAGGLSFPSGHVTLFASIVVPLAVVVPRARPLAVVVVVAIAAARVGVDAHFVSDTLGALTLVAATAWLLGRGIRPRRPSRPR